MQLIEGKKIADKILDNLKDEIQASGKKPKLAVLLVGNDSASEIYVNLKKNSAERVGIDFELIRFNEENSEEEIIAKIQELNQNEKVSGMIVQLPLPEKFVTQKIINAIDPKKDVDGFSAQGGSASGGHPDNILKPVFPMAIMELIKSTSVDLENKKAMVLANSDIFGKTMKNILEENKIMADYVLRKDLKIPPSPPFTKGDNLSPFSKGRTEEGFLDADIIISAVGKAGIIKAEMVKAGAIVIDGGITKIDGKVFGDVDFENVKNKTSFITPVPGGVGPMTIACLLRNVFLASKIIK